MKLQTNTLLALYSVLDFASQSGRQLSTADIAAKYGVSMHHLAKVLRTLGRAGLLESARGVGGGYRFAGNPKRLALLDVVELFEDISARTGTQAGTGPATAVGRALGMVFTEIDDIAKATFRSITLDTMLKLIERQRRPNAGKARRRKD